MLLAFFNLCIPSVPKSLITPQASYADCLKKLMPQLPAVPHLGSIDYVSVIWFHATGSNTHGGINSLFYGQCMGPVSIQTSEDFDSGATIGRGLWLIKLAYRLGDLTC